MRRGAGVLAAVLLLAVTPLARAGSTPVCSLPTRHTGVAYRSPALPHADLTLYGDSITYQAWRGLARVRTGLAVDAFWGRATHPTVTALAHDAAVHTPKVVVLAIGTNDIPQPAGLVLEVQRARALLPASVRLLWVNTYVDTTPGWVGVDLQVAAIPGVEVVDWASTNLRARGTATTSPLLSDGIHLTCEGAKAWVDLVNRAIVRPQLRPVGAAPGPGTAPTPARR